MDGSDAEFCEVPAISYDLLTAPWVNPAPPPEGAAITVTARVAWSEEALHLHLHVDDAEIDTNPELGWLYEGDAVELFLASSASELSGPYSSDLADGIHIIIVPPSQNREARAVYERWGDTREYVGLDALPQIEWLARAVEGGYDVELRFPWSVGGRNTRAAGDRIGFYFVVDESGKPTKRAAEAGLLPQDPGGTTVEACGSEGQKPWCNNRTWCMPTLQE